MNTSNKKDGGPAFGHAAENRHCCGMSLRDWFAGQAIAASKWVGGADDTAEAAYELADALLKAREEDE